MCGIAGALGPKRAIDIAELVKTRGTQTWSMARINIDKYTLVSQYQSKTVFNSEEALDFVNEDVLSPVVGEDYYILHLQSPTARDHTYHPAVSENRKHFLWHNGMMDSNEHGKFEGRPWDTKLLLDMLVVDDQPVWENLNNFQGSFACYYLQVGVGLFAFRNAISPQFSSGYEFGSVKFDEADKLQPNRVYSILNGKEIASFSNTYNPFGV